MKQKKEYAERLISFLNQSPTAYHAAANAKKMLSEAGFKELDLKSNWKLKPGNSYFLSRNESALIAFTIGEDKLEDGIRMISAHTDSPALKLKPEPIYQSKDNYILLNTEIYGGPILNTWFDRPLSAAGKIVTKGKSTFTAEVSLVDFKKPIAVIPNLAIHLNRDINDGIKIDKQKDLRAIIDIASKKNPDTLKEIIAEKLNKKIDKILDFELFLYSSSRGYFAGVSDQYISAGRQDNLSMVHAGLTALLESKNQSCSKMLVLYDNEEIGSKTRQGADSPFLLDSIKRILNSLGNSEEIYKIMEKSFLISADMAHAVHPNFESKHDETNRPLLNRGPVLKYNANQNYTTNSETAAVLIDIMKNNNIPYQTFANRSDQKGGSTIGPLAATQIGIKSIDIGSPLLAMHSIREMGGSSDHYYMIKTMQNFYDI
ncbi:MAG: M18 family aminopeptidase [Bacillota bacterium]